MDRPCLSLALSLGFAVAWPAFVAGCKSDAPPEPISSDESRVAEARAARRDAAREAASAAASSPPPGARRRPAKPVASVPVSDDDPIKGVWSLADATKGLKGSGALLAEIEVEAPSKGAGGGKIELPAGGKLTCTLFEDRAPISVANFVGLARGLRPWKDPTGVWVKKSAYDGTTFHRIIKGFMIQGGDARGTGTGEPGYVIPDEVWEGAQHDRAGLLCMANRGPNTNGAQFFITDGAAPHLDTGYTIFGECGPVELIHKLASVEGKDDRPNHPPKMRKVTIRRGPAPQASASSSSRGR